MLSTLVPCSNGVFPHLPYDSPADLGEPLDCHEIVFSEGGGVTSSYIRGNSSQNPAGKLQFKLLHFPPFLLIVEAKGSRRENGPLWAPM